MNAALRKLHNPRGRTCACDADCWCNSTAVGRLVKWWFPAGRLHHTSRVLEAWKTPPGVASLEEWKRRRAEG
jgi:hypothetical protein